MANKLGKPKGTFSLSTEYLIEKLQEAAVVAHPITYWKMRDLKGFPSTSVYEQRFGSWSNALKQANIAPVSRSRSKNVIKRRWANLNMRFRILNRDNFTCQYCGRTPQDGARLVIDHKDPASNGGETSIDNLITSCFECNAGKGDIIISFREPNVSV